MKWLTLANRNVWRNGRRSLMVMLIIAVGAFAAMVSIGFMLASFQGLRESTILGGVGHIQVSASEGLLSESQVSEVQAFGASDARVRFTMTRLNFDGLISTGPSTATVQIIGVEPEFERRMSSVFAPVTMGKALPLNYDAQNPQIVLGRDLAARLEAAQDQELTMLGTTIDGVLNAIDLNLKGSYTTGIPDLDSRQGMTHIETARFLLNSDDTETLVFVLKNSEKTDEVKADLLVAFPNLTVRTWLEVAPFYSRVVTLYVNIFTVLGAVLALVVSLSVVNVVILAINERLREMGTMLALGISRPRVRGIFAMEGAIMGLIASSAGVLAGGLVAVIVSQIGFEIPPPPGRSVGYPLVILVNFSAGALILGAFTLMTMAMAWLPTAKLGKLEIVDFLTAT